MSKKGHGKQPETSSKKQSSAASQKGKRARKRKSEKQLKSQSIRPLVDIVLPFYGEIGLARQTIAHVPEACGDIPYQLILVDNGTPNNLGRELFAELDNSVIKHWLKINQGYPGGVNAGAHRGSAPLIFVLTSDVFMEPGSIAEAVKEMDDPEIGVVGCKLLFSEGTPHGQFDTVQHAGICFNLAAKPFHIFMSWSKDHPKVNQRREMAAVTGAALLTRRNLFMKTGGFSMEYGGGTFEDMEYCFAIRLLGKKVIYSPKVVGYHYVGGSIIQGAHKSGFNLTRNEAVFRSRVSGAIAWDEWRYW